MSGKKETVFFLACLLCHKEWNMWISADQVYVCVADRWRLLEVAVRIIESRSGGSRLAFGTGISMDLSKRYSEYWAIQPRTLNNVEQFWSLFLKYQLTATSPDGIFDMAYVRTWMRRIRKTSKIYRKWWQGNQRRAIPMTVLWPAKGRRECRPCWIAHPMNDSKWSKMYTLQGAL